VVRGAGETQLEVDRRLVRKRIGSLEKKLAGISQQRKTRREGRLDELSVALVGYTNSGKSTLMNGLTGSHVLVEDKLFATLDSTVRHITPADHPDILLTDTVGFIKKLPHGLIASFKSTLEEVHVANLLLHVIDLSDSDFQHKIEYTAEVLHEIDCDEKPRLMVFNKIDLLSQPSKLPAIVRSIYKNSICVSGETGEGLADLKEMIFRHFYVKWNAREILLDYDRSSLLSSLYDFAKVEEVDYRPDGIHIRFRCSDTEFSRLQISLGLDPDAATGKA